MERNSMVTRIIADCTVDMFAMEGFDFQAVPLTISTAEREFVDDEALNVDEMLDYLGSYKGRSYTACPNTDAWLRCYEGADVIYVVALTSGLSGTYNAAVNAANIYVEDHPETKIRVFDSLSAGPEVRLMVDCIAEQIQKGKSFEETCQIVEDYAKHTRIFFALESFHNFAQNGRVNKAVAAAAGVLNIRIMATASTKGDIEIIGKCRGEKGELAQFKKCLEDAGYDGGKVYLSQCKNPELAQKVVDMIKEVYPAAETKIYETRGLCSYYAEKGGILLGCECKKSYEE